MNKIIKVNNCWECPYSDFAKEPDLDNSDLGLYCFIGDTVQLIGNYMEIAKTQYIPDFCPLENENES